MTPNETSRRNPLLFPFNGDSTEAVSPVRIIREYPFDGILERKDDYIAGVHAVYEKEKSQTSLTTEMDLADPDDMERMYFHPKVHAITGLLEWGTSTTFSIPYWDIQALIVGLQHMYGPEEAEAVLQINYAEAINALCGYLSIAISLHREFSTFNSYINDFASFGTVTRSDLSEEAQSTHSQWSAIEKRFANVIAAKYRHLLFLTDQLRSQELRELLRMRIESIERSSMVDLKETTIDMGIDCGLIADSYRPAYEIHVYKQLHHLNQRTYAVTRDECPIFTREQMRISIGRMGDSKSQLIDPASDITLPWKFNDGK